VPHSIKRFSNVEEEAVTIFLIVIGSHILLVDPMQSVSQTLSKLKGGDLSVGRRRAPFPACQVLDHGDYPELSLIREVLQPNNSVEN